MKAPFAIKHDRGESHAVYEVFAELSGVFVMRVIGVCFLASLFSATCLAENKTQVLTSANSIIYKGELTAEANERAFSLLTPAITTLKIDSLGGDVKLGMAVGDWVYKNGLNVEVLELCFSSCANYIFPAGKAKILGKASIVGWHGGATQTPTLELAEQLLKFKPEEVAELIHDMNQQIVRETLFFKKIGVEQASTVYGQQSQYDEGKDCVGWTYSLRAMKAFGIQGVVLKAGEWSPPASYRGGCIFTISEASTNFLETESSL